MLFKFLRNKVVVFLITLLYITLNKSYAQVPFVCSGDIYQVSGTVGRGNVSLYKYNINTGTRTLIKDLGRSVNAIAYNTVDNMIWGYDQNSYELVRIDANGTITAYTIPNLPNDIYNSADFLPDGRLLFYRTDTGTQTRTYYVVDLNPARTSTYLQLVEPAQTGYPLDTDPYGATMSQVTLTNDFVYNPTTGLMVGLGTGANLGKIVRLNPSTGLVTVAQTRVTGDGIESVTGAFGATFIDAGNENILYVFSNSTGNFYRVDLMANTAIRISTSAPAGNNDGAGCPLAVISYPITGNVFNDANGLKDTTVNGTGITTSNLKAVLYNHTTGKVEGIDPILANGTFSFGSTPGNSYSVYLTTSSATIGQTSPPAVTLPTGWVNTGENLGSSSGNDGTNNGLLSIGEVNSAVTNVNFGIQRQPESENQTYTLTGQTYVNQLIPLDGTISNAQALRGSDPEDMPTSGSLGGKSVRIETLPTNGELYYDGQLVTPNTIIDNLNPALLQIKLTGTGYSSTSFTWSYIDNAGQIDPTPGTYTLNWDSPLPVRLVGFKVTTEGTVSTITWETIEEVMSSHFVVERSSNGKNWIEIGQVQAFGESTVTRDYLFQDSSPLNGENFYRLKMVDKDGSFDYSTIRSLVFDLKITSYVYPNPVAQQLKISSNEFELDQISSINIYDLSGAQVHRQDGLNAEGIEISKLQVGSYILTITTKSGETHKTKFAVVK